MPDRLLLIADDAFDDPSAVPACAERVLGEAGSVRVVAPIIASRLDTLTDDESAHSDARDRATRVVRELRDRGIEADGEDSEIAPFETAVTELRANDYDGVVVATTGEDHWREEGLLERLREATDVPVTHVVVDDGDA